MSMMRKRRTQKGATSLVQVYPEIRCKKHIAPEIRDRISPLWPKLRGDCAEIARLLVRCKLCCPSTVLREARCGTRRVVLRQHTVLQNRYGMSGTECAYGGTEEDTPKLHCPWRYNGIGDRWGNCRVTGNKVCVARVLKSAGSRATCTQSVVGGEHNWTAGYAMRRRGPETPCAVGKDSGARGVESHL
eukprot:423415-Rhodomonas_salina.2